MNALHPVQRRYLAEDLVRLKRPEEEGRYAASQRQGRIDPNPHQIDAVIFALKRLSEGGCILADEVGLGKTIEAGLVIAQLLAEGARRILIVVPKPLLGQWQNELYELFALDAREVTEENAEGDGVFIVGREMAGGKRGSKLLQRAAPFDLCVIDEAHEMFAGIYKRFNKAGEYQEESNDAVIAHRVRDVLGMTPVLLLTATPIQNSLVELWGLVQYVEPTGTLLGDLPTFRELFCGSDDRTLADGQEFELKRRINQVCQRTLRRQAQEFMEKPFVDRRGQLFYYTMRPAERSLYQDVTTYLLEPRLCAFTGRQRKLLLIGFHRRMASSHKALADSLAGVADRLRKLLEGQAPDDGGELLRAFGGDLEDDDLLEDMADAPDDETPLTPERIQAELTRVEGFVERARNLGVDSKARALIEALQLVQERAEDGRGSGKAVIFTESVSTQNYLRELLLGAGWADQQITLFRGNNDTERAREALALWQAEVADQVPGYHRPSRQVAVRLALVHEFKTRSRVFISTEAGAKGLNLQFCDTIINYDLPWNPQRIEQRIGRCHRYGQQRDVTVINFLARDNEAQQLTFDILAKKLDLFGTLLDASDRVLFEPKGEAPETLVSGLGAGFRSQLQHIYNQARTADDMAEDIRELRDTMDTRREEYETQLARTASLIESRFDEEVRQVFHRLKEHVPIGLARFDRAVIRLVEGYLTAQGVAFDRSMQDARVHLHVPPNKQLPEGLRAGGHFVVGSTRDLQEGDPINLSHPLFLAAVADARQASRERQCVRLTAGERLSSYRGQRGVVIVHKLRLESLDNHEQLIPVALMEGARSPLGPDVAVALLELSMEAVPAHDPPVRVDEEALEDALEEQVFLYQLEQQDREEERFKESLARLECFIEDRCMIERQERTRLLERIAQAQDERDRAISAARRKQAVQKLQRREAKLDEVEARLEQLQRRDDDTYRRLRTELEARRFARPRVERLFAVPFEVA